MSGKSMENHKGHANKMIFAIGNLYYKEYVIFFINIPVSTKKIVSHDNIKATVEGCIWLLMDFRDAYQ